ncbi:7TM diverse intracellular signaling domain-containing protein [Polaromonas sp. A23]|uniref:sensor domain-containing diguanylate cyclase n=1 Tax=Polaromonas sp. A23 TaxID=1944133 RepID=UPI001438904F|nr:7TM diverse intracellular signaling domain-containing protein [Polaromonas sp. A23]
MYRKASLRSFFMVLLCLVLHTGHAQDFDRLYGDSTTPALAQPLQWVVVPKDSVASPDAFAAGEPWGFQPYTNKTVLPTSERYDVWATFSLPASEPPQTWFIRLPGQVIFKASLFSRAPQGGWLVQAAGEALAPADWSLRTRVPSFELQTRGDRMQTYYLRYENNRPITGQPMLLSPVEYVDGASRVGVVIGLMWGMFSVLAMLSLAAFAIAHNRVFLWFGAVVVTLMFTQLVLIGYGGWRMWPQSVHLNQVMAWVSAALSMAAGAWFCAHASYARSGHPLVYRLLVAITAGSLLLAGLMAIDRNLIPRDLRNLWLALATVAILGSLVWMSLRGQAWNLLLLLGTAPIGLAALARLSYNVGWVMHIEATQAAGVLSAMVGLLWIFCVLAWRSRAALFSNHRSAALATYDPASGLMLPRMVESRLAQMLLRTRHRRIECGIVMLRWLDQTPSPDELSDHKRSTALSRIGEILRRCARDMDTVVRYEENLFLILVEGPVNREAVSEISTRIQAACIRLADKLGESNAFNLHIAIWHGTPGDENGQKILNSLQTRLRRMNSGPKRYVQFVDVAGEPASLPAEDYISREDLLAKIDAIEVSHPALHDEKSAPQRVPVR